MQDYAGAASVDVAFFKEISPFTAQQTIDAVNEKQQISAYYDVLPEKQVSELTEHFRKKRFRQDRGKPNSLLF